MNCIRTLLLTGSFLSFAFLAPASYGQINYTFSTIAGGTQGSNDGVGKNAEFYNPAGVAVDGAGNVYVADQDNDSIREMAPSGTNWIVSTIAGGTQGSQNGMGTNAQFNAPTEITIDSSTNLYIADQGNFTIRKMTLSGTNWTVFTIAGQAGVQGTNDGTNFSATFSYPTGIAIDNSGNLFVTDQGSDSIREIKPEGTNWVVSTIAGGSQGHANGAGATAQFYHPMGIAVDSSERVFVADYFNFEIRLITQSGPTWSVSTIAGQTTAGSTDGLGTNALFPEPQGITVASNGNIYVTDLNSVRQITNSEAGWLVSTIAGGTTGSADGTGPNAQFHAPFGITTDGYGDIFVADSANNAIRLGISGSSAPATGSLTVNLTPLSAVTNGAGWQLEGGAEQTNGATLTDLAPGTYTVTFANASDFTTPAEQIVTVTAHQTNMITANYTTAIAGDGSLQVLISPAGAVDAGAEWQVNNQGFETNEAIVPGLPAGTYTVSFTNVPGWITPLAQTVSITNAETTLVMAIYLPAGSLATYTVTVGASSGGSVAVSGNGVFSDGSTAIVTATPSTGYGFIGWTGEETGTNNPLSVTVTTNIQVTGNFAPTGTLTLIVVTNGDGTVSPNENGKTIIAGHTYSLKANPKTGNLFSNWTGTITTNKNPLALKMESSMVVQANFVPNPFLPLRGSYNGLFTNGVVTEETAGMLKNLTISQQGNYSATLFINGGSHGLSGPFDVGLQATNIIRRSSAQGGNLTVVMMLNPDNPPSITGTVTGVTNGTPWVANLIADRGTNGLGVANYTVLIPPDTNTPSPSLMPGGDGYLLIANNNAGTSKITGALADGTSFSESVPVSSTGYVPIYANLYGSKGLILGWLNVLTNVTDASLTWIHPPRTSGLYQAGFINILSNNAIPVSPWTNPPGNLNLFTNLAVLDTLSGTNSVGTNGLNATNSTSYAVSISSGTSSASITGTNLTGSLNLKTGAFKVMIGTGADRITGYGAIILNGTNGGGYIIPKNSTEALGIQLNGQ
jgi:uncharacterized repeat protein (TIGR02543 family)